VPDATTDGHNVGERISSGTPIPERAHSAPERDRYRGVVTVLLMAALCGAGLALAGAMWFGNLVLLDAAVTLGLTAGILITVAVMQVVRSKPPKMESASIPPLQREAVAAPEALGPPESPGAGEPAKAPASGDGFAAYAAVRLGEAPEAESRPGDRLIRIRRWFHEIDELRVLCLVIAGYAGVVLLFLSLSANRHGLLATAIAVAACWTGAGLAFTAGGYLAAADRVQLPEAPGLTKLARVAAWILVTAGVSIGIEWIGQQTIVRMLHFAALGVNAALCIGLFLLERPREEPKSWRLEIGVLSMLGSRTNILASILDAAERQLGIDLRSTWALTVVRRSLEPLIVVLCLLAWLTTSLTVVGIEEQGIIERFGVPAGGSPFMPGLHLHWPWPVDRVFRVPVTRVQALTVGHEGEEGGGPENVLWARQHAANEYTLLLGNGRDLITVDAAVQFRIVDLRAWRYHCQNPADALRAIAYRAVMRSTVNRTLSEALSENVATLTRRMRQMVQQDADALGLGVEILAFTVGGMHPPVMVAGEYQAVVSAQLGKVTAVVNAQSYHNQRVPGAEASVVTSENAARAEAAQALAQAAGQAWSFRTLESQFRAAPQEFFFRRRLETLERVLSLRGRFTVVDARFERDGGELWITP
jgi:regulator of protease activity HflC (stomatin/prohibitin superfamily)